MREYLNPDEHLGENIDQLLELFDKDYERVEHASPKKGVLINEVFQLSEPVARFFEQPHVSSELMEKFLTQSLSDDEKDILREQFREHLYAQKN